MAVSKRGIVVLGAIGGVIGLGLVAAGVAGLVDREARADAGAVQAFHDAEAEVAAAAEDRDAAIAELRTALGGARDARAASLGLLAAAEPALLADPTTRDELHAALDELTTTAALRVQADGTATLPGLPPTSRVPRFEQPAPAGREQLLAGAERVADLADPLLADAREYSDRLGEIVDAEAAVRAAGLAVVASAHAKGAATPAPELASQETVDAYTAAVAALRQPGPDADLGSLVVAYRDTWNAAVASHEDAARIRDRGAIEPTYINGILVVNKTYALPSWFGDGLTGETLAAFDAMRAEAAALGLDLHISSGFRSYWSQEAIYNRYVAADGQAEADRYSARPGHSEHQSGLTFDLNCICEGFGTQAEGIWVADNAHRFGFVVRYPQGKEAITGYIWEPWHLRYLGVPVATELYSTGLTLEEYLGITSSYD